MTDLTPKRPMSERQYEALRHLEDFPEGVAFFPILVGRGVTRSTLRALVRRGLVSMGFDTTTTLTDAGRDLLRGESPEEMTL